jgi:hypothetical protein
VARIEERAARMARYDRELLPMANDIAETFLYEMAHGRGGHTDYLLALEEAIELRTERLALAYDVAVERARLNLLTGGLLDEQAGLGRPARSAAQTFGDDND